MAYKINEDCVNCCACINFQICPEGAINEGDEACRIDPAKCTECGICYEKEEYFCPMRAIVKTKTPSSQDKKKKDSRTAKTNLKVGTTSGGRSKPQLKRYLAPIIKFWETGHDSILWNAPVLVVASALKESPTGMADVFIALTYLGLMAPTMGLGTCWAGLLQQAILPSPALKDFLGVPADHSHYFPIMLGYPKAKYYQLPGRKPPKITFG